MLTQDKQESLYHTLLVQLKELSIGTKSGDEKTRKLLEQHGSFAEIYAKNKQLFEPEKEKITKKLEKTDDFKTITINSPEYPEWLKELKTSPVLYTQGNLELLATQTIAVVGTRHPEQTDIEHGNKVLERLLAKQYTIVSGLAEGCDTLGHEYAIANGGKTIAVLGTPLNKNYPKTNKKLQEKIAQEHLLISPFPIGLDTFPSHFAYRNHITVSLSKEGIVVIKADDKSGTQHAIRVCNEQGKPIYALPANFRPDYNWIQKYNPKNTQ